LITPKHAATQDVRNPHEGQLAFQGQVVKGRISLSGRRAAETPRKPAPQKAPRRLLEHDEALELAHQLRKAGARLYEQA